MSNLNLLKEKREQARQKAEAERIAAENYAKAICVVEENQPIVLEGILAIKTALEQYPDEFELFSVDILSALGINLEELSQEAEQEIQEEIEQKLEPIKLQMALGSKVIGCHHGGAEGLTIYIGFKNRNGGTNKINCAVTWRDHFKKAFASEIDNAEPVKHEGQVLGIDQGDYPFLLKITGLNWDIFAELTQLDYSLKPEEALEKEAYQGIKSETPIAPIVETPINLSFTPQPAPKPATLTPEQQAIIDAARAKIEISSSISVTEDEISNESDEEELDLEDE